MCCFEVGMIPPLSNNTHQHLGVACEKVKYLTA